MATMMPRFLLLTLLLLGTISVSVAFQTVPKHNAIYEYRTQLSASNNAQNDGGMNRRKALTTATTVVATSLIGASAANADMMQLSAQSTALPAGLLESRVLDNVLSPPPYGMEGTDVFYPAWFAGTWKVFSETTTVLAPCGVALFGGNRTYEAALAERGPSKALKYDCRFLPAVGEQTIADREFNVKSIARVAMGENSVVDVSLATPNKFSCLLSLEGAPSLITVDLLVLNRRQEKVDDTHFDCSEVVREIVSGIQRKAAILKEVETTSLYTLLGDGTVQCRQRSATFLLPSQQDPMALQMWQATRGRPIDVRFYNVQYTKKVAS